MYGIFHRLDRRCRRSTATSRTAPRQIHVQPRWLDSERANTRGHFQPVFMGCAASSSKRAGRQEGRVTGAPPRPAAPGGGGVVSAATTAVKGESHRQPESQQGKLLLARDVLDGRRVVMSSDCPSPPHQTGPASLEVLTACCAIVPPRVALQEAPFQHHPRKPHQHRPQRQRGRALSCHSPNPWKVFRLAYLLTQHPLDCRAACRA